MNNIEEDNEYVNIVSSILYNDKFNEIRNIEHHGITRYDHSVKVSYYSYKLAKSLKLNYKEVARGGLLHDYYITDVNSDFKDRVKSTFLHPKIALKTATNNFSVSEMEADIIKSHMFPITLVIPKYAESWLVNGVDKLIGFSEFCKKFSYRFCYITNLALLFIINFRK
ncbi:MAG: HD domain-containing protein [Bacilli bacterium]